MAHEMRLWRYGRGWTIRAFLSITINMTERGLRGVVLGCKNHYGSRSLRGAASPGFALAAELVRLKVDEMVAMSTPVALAAQRATGIIPIVFTFSSDPVRNGFVASLARPGGNLTGLTDITADLIQKRLEWAMNVAAHADDSTPITPAVLENADPARVSELRFEFDPSLALVSSRWPIDRIWRANQDGAEATVDLDAAGVSLEIRRRDDDVVFRALTEATYAFRRVLHDGGCLATAAERAGAVDETFDLAGALGALVHDGVLTGVTPRPALKESS